MLFLEGERDITSPLARGQSLFEYYDRSGRNGYGVLRGILNDWCAQLPPNDRDDVIARLRSGSNREFGSALVELMIHALLCRLEFSVCLHPQVEGTSNRPDFGILDERGQISALVEVTTFNHSDDEISEARREAVIYNAVDKIRLPAGHHLGWDTRRFGRSSPPLKNLIREVDAWIRSSQLQVGDVISCEFVADDWVIEVDLFRGASKDVSSHAIHSSNWSVGWIAPEADLRAALKGKAKRYGLPKVPFLIVVADATDQVFGRDMIMETLLQALFADEAVEAALREEPEIVRQNNGFWVRDGKPLNEHVSGILFLPHVHLWGLRNEASQPTLFENPYANAPLPASLRSIHGYSIVAGRLQVRHEPTLADLLAIPDPWPPTY